MLTGCAFIKLYSLDYVATRDKTSRASMLEKRGRITKQQKGFDALDATMPAMSLIVLLQCSRGFQKARTVWLKKVDLGWGDLLIPPGIVPTNFIRWAHCVGWDATAMRCQTSKWWSRQESSLPTSFAGLITLVGMPPLCGVKWRGGARHREYNLAACMIKWSRQESNLDLMLRRHS